MRDLFGDVPPVVCAWCGEPFSPVGREGERFCEKACRQAAWRLRRRQENEPPEGEPGLFAYADPPYPGRARRYYGGEETYGGEVDHAALVRELEAGGYAGWALSTAADALREVLPLCPAGARVCAWVKPIGASTLTYGLHNTWEPLIVVGGRRRRPGKRDWFAAQPARGGGDLPGRKPIAFCAFLFGALGMQPGDELVDLFPGTGVVGRAWVEASSGPRGDASPEPGSVAEDLRDAGHVAGSSFDASRAPRGGASSAPGCDGGILEAGLWPGAGPVSGG